jgi:transposase
LPEAKGSKSRGQSEAIPRRSDTIKTDKLDAQVIAQFAETIEVPQKTVKTQTQEELTQLTQRRNDLVATRSGEKCRLKQAGQCKDSIKRLLYFLEVEIKTLDKQIHHLIEKTPQFKHQSELLDSVKGVGPILIATLLGQMPELAELNEKQAASLAGLAPFNCDSGSMRGKRQIYGGRKVVRNALYNAANVSRRYNPEMKAFYERLIEKGKPFKVAIVACARKLLTWLNAILRRDVLHTS